MYALLIFFSNFDRKLPLKFGHYNQILGLGENLLSFATVYTLLNFEENLIFAGTFLIFYLFL